jgi:hypothetical protein
MIMKSKIRMCLISKEKAKKIEDAKMSLNNSERYLEDHNYSKALYVKMYYAHLRFSLMN